MLKSFNFFEDNGNSLRKARHVKGMLRLYSGETTLKAVWKVEVAGNHSGGLRKQPAGRSEGEPPRHSGCEAVCSESHLHAFLPAIPRFRGFFQTMRHAACTWISSWVTGPFDQEPQELL